MEILEIETYVAGISIIPRNTGLNFCSESFSQDLHALFVNFFLFLHCKQRFPQEEVFLLTCVSVLFKVVAISLKNTKF